MQVPFTFGIEIFEAGHETTPHSHAVAHELFCILTGETAVALTDAPRLDFSNLQSIAYPNV